MLDYEAQSSYQVTLSVQDASVAGSSALAADFRLEVIDVDETPPEPSSEGSSVPTSLVGIAENG